MSTQSLPVIQSIPHPGLAVPPEVADNLAIDDVTIYNDCDLWNDRLFDFTHPDLADLWPDGAARPALAVVSMPVARVLIDANRPPDSLDDPDGAVKSHTSYGDPIYRTPLGRPTQEMLRDRYWRPFHDELDAALRHHAGKLRLFLDCHNMAQRGPSAYADPGQVRPLICIANNGDGEGNFDPAYGPLIAPPGFARQAAQIAADLFHDLALLEPDPTQPAPVVALNAPFHAGYIARHYTGEAYRRTLGSPARNYYGLMVEVNRGLFVGDQTTRTPVQPPNEDRIRLIRRRLYRWLLRVSEMLEKECTDA